MPALDFQPRFATAILSGAKRQTIRRIHRTRPVRVHDRLYLYQGRRGRSAGGARLLREERCREVRVFSIRCPSTGLYTLWIDDDILSPEEALALAVADGFGSITEMLLFFDAAYTLPFYGVLIRW